MTIDLNGTNIGDIIALVSWVAGLVSMLVVGLLVYFMVRPPRHVRELRRQGRRAGAPVMMDENEAEDLWRLVDRMEARLEVLERALADHTGDSAGQPRVLEPAERREDGRTK